MRPDKNSSERVREAFEHVDVRGFIWAATRPGVMSTGQRRRFLAEAVLAPIEGLLTNERSLNILRKLHTNEQITQEDKDAADDETEAPVNAAYAVAYAVAAVYATEATEASWAVAASVASVASAVWWATYNVAGVADAADSARAEARNAQAKWIRENVKLSDLHIN